jgi:hypothetical protein
VRKGWCRAPRPTTPIVELTSAIAIAIAIAIATYNMVARFLVALGVSPEA